VTLIPYPDSGAGTELEQRRSVVAREIFFEESLKGQPDDVLPLAMLALDHGIIKWLDLFMVRREIAQRERNVWGLGISPRPLRASHLRQYIVQLNEVQKNLGSHARVIASEHFSVLPPAGPMPASGINGSDFSFNYFPAEMDVELSIVPEDELPALLEDSMLLPPLDLELTGDAQESTSVLVVMPVPRHQFRSLSQSLPTLTRELQAAQPGMTAKRKPIVALNQLMMRRLLVPVLPAVLSADSVWRNELGKQSQLWYLRRRNLHYKAEVTSWSVAMHSEEHALEAAVNTHIKKLNLKTRYHALLNHATTAAAAELTAFLASPVMLKGSDTAVRAAVSELEKTDTVDSLAVMKVVERFSEPNFGEGLARLKNSNEAFSGNTHVVENVAKSGLLPELDRLGRTLPAEQFKALSDELVTAGSGNNAAALAKVTKVIENKAAASNVSVHSGPLVSNPLGSGLHVASGITIK